MHNVELPMKHIWKTRENAHNSEFRPIYVQCLTEGGERKALNFLLAWPKFGFSSKSSTKETSISSTLWGKLQILTSEAKGGLLIIFL